MLWQLASLVGDDRLRYERCVIRKLGKAKAGERNDVSFDPATADLNNVRIVCLKELR
jgi:hypothetical protein